MTRNMLKLGMAVLFVGSLPCLAQNTTRTADATGQCKDGTYTTAANKSGACSGHKGVKDWYQTVGGKSDPDIKAGGKGSTGVGNGGNQGGAASSNGAAMSSQRAKAINKKSGNTAVATPDDTTQKTIPGPAANGSASASASTSSSKGSSSHSMASRTAAAGGAPGLVWVNTETKVYHCYGTSFYGKTKQGKYMSEQEAQQMGAKADHGKSCSTGK